MQIKIFQSSKGDCLLISSFDNEINKNRHILVDGGMSKSFREHVALELSMLQKNNEVVDLVCVSHIDEDHIQGILKYLDDIIDWRVYNYHKNTLNRNPKKPKSPEPTRISAIWHNAFSEQLGKNTGELEDMLANYSTLMMSGNTNTFTACADIATSVKQGIELSKKISSAQLDIPLNPHHEGKLVMYKKGQRTISVGKMKLKIIGPTKEELEDLREEWDKWVKKNKEAIAKLLSEMNKDQDRLDLSSSQKKELGDIDAVTASNLASIMCYLYQGRKRILLTGDGHRDHIIRGLELIGRLKNGRGLHVQVLKVQHHGSKNNIDEVFSKRITGRSLYFLWQWFPP